MSLRSPRALPPKGAQLTARPAAPPGAHGSASALPDAAALRGSVLLELLPKKQRGSLGVRPADREQPTALAPPPLPGLLGAAAPGGAAAPPLLGPEPLPSQRAEARALWDALQRMFSRAPLSKHEASPARMAEEWQLLDLVVRHLVRLLATRCMEWGQVLDTVRVRLVALWSCASHHMSCRSLCVYCFAGLAPAKSATLWTPADRSSHL